MKENRYSQKYIALVISNINHYTEHTVIAYYTQGCGTSLKIDGIDYNHLKRQIKRIESLI